MACEAGQAKAREIMKPGLGEYDIFRAVYAAVLEASGRPCLIYGDFRATTPTQIKAGGLPTNYKLKAGDFFILDSFRFFGFSFVFFFNFVRFVDFNFRSPSKFAERCTTMSSMVARSLGPLSFPFNFYLTSHAD